MDRVKTDLRDYNYGKSQLKLAEVAWNKELEGYMKEYFVNVKKSATTSGGNLDLLVGSGKNAVAIELKLSREIKEAGISQKARGQIEDYSKDFHSNLLVVVAGEKKEQNDKFVQAVKSKVDSLKANYIFISAD